LEDLDPCDLQEALHISLSTAVVPAVVQGEDEFRDAVDMEGLVEGMEGVSLEDGLGLDVGLDRRGGVRGK
jgi:hypothetical protein